MKQSPVTRPLTSEMPDFRAMSAEEARPYARVMQPYENLAAASRELQSKEPKSSGLSAVSTDGMRLPGSNDRLRALEIVEERNTKLGDKAIIAFMNGEKLSDKSYFLQDAQAELRMQSTRGLALKKAEVYKRDNSNSARTVGILRRYGWGYNKDKVRSLNLQEAKENLKKR